MTDVPRPEEQAVVTVHLWHVPGRRVAAAMRRVALDRRAVRGCSGIRFAKLLGTGGMTGPADMDLRRWALIASWTDAASAVAFERSGPARRWTRIADETWRVQLRTLSARGRWSRRAPFGKPAPARWDGRVAAVTRARVRPHRTGRFWPAAGPVAADLANRPGLLLGLGIGEAPGLRPGTFSVWDSDAALKAFAYQGARHVEAIRRSNAERWYAEELFARFAVLTATGTVDGRDPLG